MRILPNVALAALLLGSTGATSAFAAGDTGCPPGMHRAESEAGGVGSRNLDTRKAEAEGGGVGSRNLDTRKAEAEGGGVGSRNLDTRKAEAEGGGVGSRNLDTRKAEAQIGGSQRLASSTPCTK
jgi:hypothetical protein